MRLELRLGRISAISLATGPSARRRVCPGQLAVAVGFEPTEGLHPHTLSRSSSRCLIGVSPAGRAQVILAWYGTVRANYQCSARYRLGGRPGTRRALP
jgi:hypothetical protein